MFFCRSCTPLQMYLTCLCLLVQFPPYGNVAMSYSLFKGGDPSDVNNYRPISIRTIAKILRNISLINYHSTSICSIFYLHSNLGLDLTFPQPRLF